MLPATESASASPSGMTPPLVPAVAYAGPGWAELPRRFGIRGHPALSRPFPVDA